jgi:cytochrome o ubiquinol oxidase subunit 2
VFSRLRLAKAVPRVAILVLATVVTAGCSESILAPVGPVASGERIILLDALGIMLVIVVPTIVATLGFAWWFRASNKSAAYRPTWVYSDRLEVVVWCIPALTVLFLSGLAWIGSHTLDPARPLESRLTPLEVEVVSLDWKWLFIYPNEHIAAVNQLVLPVGRPVHLRLTSSSVMNVFFVPRLAGEIYTMNGMVTQLNLQGSRIGNYPGLSAQFSGDGFASMGFTAMITSQSAFDQFVARTRGVPRTLDDSAYKSLSRQSQADPVQFFGDVSADLFDGIVSRRIPASEGPATMIPGHDMAAGGN